MSQRENLTVIDGDRWHTGLKFRLTEKGTWNGTSLHNISLFLAHHPHLRALYWYDEFSDEIYIDRPLAVPVGSYPRPIQDHDETELAAWINSRGLAPSIQNTAACIRSAAFKNKRNPILDWAVGLQWDGKKRLDGWLSYYAGADANDYTKLVGRRFMISAMARVLEPGCKVDTMLILEGPQGLKKSTLIAELAGPGWFTDQVGDITSKDASQIVQGVWIIEVAEMDKFSRHEAGSVKAFLTRTFDRYRPPYGRNVVRRERRCVFFGTINPDGVGYLKDTTGNRRYWPVRVRSVDIDAIRADREQLWAEAKAAFASGERWWVDGDEEVASIFEAEQDARRDDDVWEPKIREWIEAPERKLKPNFTSSDVLWHALSVSLKDQKQSEKIRAAKILKSLGCRDVNYHNGIKGRSWELP